MKSYLPILIFVFLFIFPPIVNFVSAEDYSLVAKNFSFTRNLGLGNRGQDVLNLQCIMGLNPMTGYFDQNTKNGLILIQNSHKSEILNQMNLTIGTGYFGTTSRSFFNSQIADEGSNSTSSCPTYVPPVRNPNPTYTPKPKPRPPRESPSSQNDSAISSLWFPGLTYPLALQPSGNGYQNFPGTQGLSAPAYTVIPNQPALQAYINHGEFQGEDHRGVPCYIGPVIAYLRDLVPQLFPWARDMSDCRSPQHNRAVGGSPTSAHLVGEAVDFSSRNGDITQFQGDELSIWAMRNGGSFWLKQVIWNGRLHNSVDGGFTWNDQPGSDHYDHVHIGR